MTSDHDGTEMADIFGDIDHVPCLGTAGCFFPMVVDFKWLPMPFQTEGYLMFLTLDQKPHLGSRK